MTLQPPHDIVRAVRAELTIPGRYQLHVAAQRKSWFDLLLQKLDELYEAFIHAIARSIHIGPNVAAAIGDIVAVALVLAVAVVIARLLAGMPSDESAFGDAEALLPQRNAQALARAAGEAASRGEYARAVRLLFGASVVLLDLRGVVHDDESATINELRRKLRARAAEATEPFGVIARAYTAAAYAERGVDEATWLDAARAYGQLARSAS